jgi:hypothetical protein
MGRVGGNSCKRLFRNDLDSISTDRCRLYHILWLIEHSQDYGTSAWDGVSELHGTLLPPIASVH